VSRRQELNFTPGSVYLCWPGKKRRDLKRHSRRAQGGLISFLKTNMFPDYIDIKYIGNSELLLTGANDYISAFNFAQTFDRSNDFFDDYFILYCSIGYTPIV
jgi:hypothetical protein